MNTTCRLLLASFALSSQGRDYTAIVVDETSQPLPDVAVSVLFGRLNDPRYSSMKKLEGTTDAKGRFTFQAGDDMRLVRLRATKPNHYDADITEVHGLAATPANPTHTITLPRSPEGIPLCYKEVRFRRQDGRLPAKVWVGFDLALGDVVRPWGKGETVDISFWNEGEKVGWTQSHETIDRYRHDQDHARFSEEEFDAMYGSFRGTTRLRGEARGDGLLRSPSFWPYCLLKMPATAPDDGYAPMLELPFATLPYPTKQDDFVGYFLRVRTKIGPDGKVVSANYAKIQGAIRTDLGVVAFRYYYNPTPNDRRLAHDMKNNLLQPGPGTPERELERYQSYEP